MPCTGASCMKWSLLEVEMVSNESLALDNKQYRVLEKELRLMIARKAKRQRIWIERRKEAASKGPDAAQSNSIASCSTMATPLP